VAETLNVSANKILIRVKRLGKSCRTCKSVEEKVFVSKPKSNKR
jgi:hypothetical protein